MSSLGIHIAIIPGSIPGSIMGPMLNWALTQNIITSFFHSHNFVKFEKRV